MKLHRYIFAIPCEGDGYLFKSDLDLRRKAPITTTTWPVVTWDV